MSKNHGLSYEDIIQLSLFPDGSPFSSRLHRASLFQHLLEKDAETHEKAVRFASLVNQEAVRSLYRRLSSWREGSRPLLLNNFLIPEAYEAWCKETEHQLKRLVKGVNLLAGFKGQLVLTVKGLQALDPNWNQSDQYTVLVWIEDLLGMQQDVHVDAKIGKKLELPVNVEESFLRMQVWRTAHQTSRISRDKPEPCPEIAAEVRVAVYSLTQEEEIDGVLPVFARTSGHAGSAVPIFDVKAPDANPAGFTQAVHLDMFLCLTTERPSDDDINLAQCFSGSGDLGAKERMQELEARTNISSPQEAKEKELSLMIRKRWDWAIRTVLKGIKLAKMRQGRKEQAALVAKSRVLQQSEAVQEMFRYLLDQMWQLWSRTRQLENARRGANPPAVPVGLTQSVTMEKLRTAGGLFLDDQPLYYILERYDATLYAAVQNFRLVGEFIPDMRFFHPLFMFASICGIRPKLLKAELVLKILNQWQRANDAVLTFMLDTMNELKAEAFANKLSLYERKLFQMLLPHVQRQIGETLQLHHQMLDPLDSAGRRVLLEVVAHYIPKFNTTTALAREVLQISHRRNGQILSKCDVHAVDHALKNLNVKGSEELQQIGTRLAEVWEQGARDFEADLGWEAESKDVLRLRDEIVEHYKQMREASQLMISGAPSWPYALYGQESMAKLEAAIMQVNKVMEKYELAEPLEQKKPRANFYLNGVGGPGFDSSSSSKNSSTDRYWYKVVVYTSDIKGAGTDSEVHINIIGSAKSSGRLVLNEEHACDTTRERDLFEQGEKNEFRVYSTSYLEFLTEIEVGIDGHGKGHSWHLDRIEVIDETEKQTWYFECNEWLSRNRGSDMKLVRKLKAHKDPPSARKETYHIEVQTSDLKGAGTDAKVKLTMRGSCTYSQLLSKQLTNCFERGKLDRFQINCQYLGNIESIEVALESKIGHVPSDDWHLQDIRIINKKTDVQWVFLCNLWFNKETPKRELHALDESDLVLYRVIVTTSDVSNAGTDARVSISLEGDVSNSGLKRLKIDGKDTFERASTDEFSLRCQDLGRVKWMKLGHDGFPGKKLISFGGSDWHVAKVDVVDVRRSQVYTFPCDFWLGKSLSSKVKSERVVQALPPKEIQVRRMVWYFVTVYTSDLLHANSNVKRVVVELIGQDRLSSGKQQLRIPKNGFQRGSADSTKLECTDVGQLEYLVLGSTGSSFGDSWHVDRVEVALGDHAPVVFPCNNWFSESRADKKTERVLYPSKGVIGGGSAQSEFTAGAPTFTLLDWPKLLWPKVEEQIQTITRQVPTMIQRHLDSITTWTAVSERTPVALEIRPVVESTLGLIDACLDQVILVIAHSGLKAQVATSVLTNAVQSNVQTVSQFIKTECMESLMKVQPKSSSEPITIFDDEGPAAGMLHQIMIRVNSMIKYQKAVQDTVGRFIDQTTKGNIMPVDTVKVKRQGELTSYRIKQQSFQVMSTLHKASRFGFLVILSDGVQSLPETQLVSVLPNYLLQKMQQIRSNILPDRLSTNADANWSALLEAAKRLVLGLAVWELQHRITLSDEQHVLLEACLKALEIQLSIDLEDQWVPKESLLFSKMKSHVRLLLEAGALPTQQLRKLMNDEALEHERILAAKDAEPDIPYQGSEVVVEMDDVMQLQQNQNNLDTLDFIRLLRCRPDGKQAAQEKLQDLSRRNRMQVLFGLPLFTQPQLFSGPCTRSCPKAINQAEKIHIPGEIFIFPSYLCFTSLLEAGGPSPALATSDLTFILSRGEDVTRVAKRSTDGLEITLSDETYLEIKFRGEAVRDDFMQKWEAKGVQRRR